jgi:hypothetical protein
MHLIGDAFELRWQAFDPFHEEDRVLDPAALGAPRAARESIRARVDRDRERVRLGARAVENVAPVARANVNDDAATRGGYPGELTDVNLDEAFAEKSTHAQMVDGRGGGRFPARACAGGVGARKPTPPREHDRRDREQRPSLVDNGVSVIGLSPTAPARGVDRLERIFDEALRSAERARHIETPVEASEILRGLERLFEGGLRETQR